MAGSGAYAVRLRVDYVWVPAGVGGVGLGSQQANNPGFGASGTPGEIPFAQSATDFISEIVPGGASPTLANFLTALQAAAADLNTRMNTPNLNAFCATPGATLLSQAQGWSIGNP